MTREPVDIGSRLELLVDDHLIETMQGARLRLHHPVPREVCLVFDQPWEGNACHYVTTFHDGDLVRMYYGAWNLDTTGGKLVTTGEQIAYAESEDGITWRRPELGLYEVAGSRANNVIWEGKAAHGFAPFRDQNPTCPPEEQYKAVGEGGFEGKNALWALTSPDGLHWAMMGDRPILGGCPFDSQNLVFYDTLRGEYRAYVRFFRDGVTRDILTTTSPDFRTWAEYEQLRYPGAPNEQLYTNQVQPYFRAPHIFIGMPTRYVERSWGPSLRALPDLENREQRSVAHERYATAITDALLMTSRDGVTFHRWPEAFIPPGPQRQGSWAYGDTYLQCGLVQTPSGMGDAAPELSLYGGEGYWTDGPSRLRRYTMRMDGFASAYADLDGGEFITRPLRFAGDRLVLNFATSAAGALRVELLDPGGHPVEGFALADCDEVYGDEVARTVTWNESADVSALVGRPVRLRFALHDADLFSFRFTTNPG